MTLNREFLELNEFHLSECIKLILVAESFPIRSNGFVVRIEQHKQQFWDLKAQSHN